MSTRLEKTVPIPSAPRRSIGWKMPLLPVSFRHPACPLVLTTLSDRSGSTLDYYDRLSHEEDTIYIFLRTPQEPITLAASLAVRYNLYLALLSFVLCRQP